MTLSKAAQTDLRAILSETPQEARERSRLRLDQALPDPDNIALFGAGNTGREVLNRLRRAGVEPVAFIDDTPAKQGTTIDGLRVMGRQQAAETLKPDVTVLVTVLNPKLTFVQAQALLAETGLKAESFMLSSWLFPEECAGLCNVMPPEAVLREKDSILACDALWADAISRETFARQIAWRMSLDFTRLPVPRLDDIYFPKDLDINLSPNVFFVDAGAYDGDTLAHFLTHTRGAFAGAVCIEPDPENHARLERRIADQGLGDRVTALNCGLGAKAGVLSFNATADMSAAFDAGGTVSMPVKRLADVMPAGQPAYAKFDIEGAEWDALNGSAEHVTANNPKLAVSVYHLPEDLWRLPLLMARLLPTRRIYLRAHGVDGTDVICYAV
ncbi:FkbM family methyltransferase [Roseovarius sp.]|uniref:FkbM family methyltransferase n=1 Tax=Roseovarius sp. TaxID=1486281 RepID=UPI003B598CDB